MFTEAAEFTWFYWSAPFPDEPVRVWWTYHRRVVEQLPASVLRSSDGQVFMYREIGFFRASSLVNATKPTQMTRDGRRWAEVLRSSPHASTGWSSRGWCCQENDNAGIWYYAARGSGFWLDLGSTTSELEYGTFRRCERGQICCLGDTCNTTEVRSSDTVIISGRPAPVEVVDLRPYGTKPPQSCLLAAPTHDSWCAPTGDVPRSPCGGRCPQLDGTGECGASSRHLRTGLQASGGACGCVNEDQTYLNCGADAPPHAAHRASLALFNTMPVRGRCINGADGISDAVDLSAPSPSMFFAAAANRSCLFAYLWWPPLQ